MIQHKRMMPDVLHFNQLQHLIGLFSETIKALELYILILQEILFTSVPFVFLHCGKANMFILNYLVQPIKQNGIVSAYESNVFFKLLQIMLIFLNCLMISK